MSLSSPVERIAIRPRPGGFRRAVLACLLGALTVFSVPSNAVAGTNRWTTNGPEGGIVRALAIDPRDPNQVLAGTQGGGIFRSIDGGLSWRRSSSGLHKDATIWQLAFAPTEPTIAYAATDSGAYRSDDGGQRWTRIYAESSTISVTVDPRDAGTAFITASLTVYRTTDGGESWREIPGPHGIMGVSRIVFAPSDPLRVYASSHGEILRSDDAGLTWTTVDRPRDHMLALAVHPSDRDTLLAGTMYEGVFRSTDAGSSWSPVNAGLPKRPGSTNLQPVEAVTFDPIHTSRVLAATGRRGYVYRSTDGGASWRARPIGAPYAPRTIAVGVSGDPIWIGTTEGGAYRSVDAGLTWSRANDGLVGSQVNAVLVRADNAKVVLAGTGGQGIFRSTNGGADWVPSGLPAKRITSLSSSPANPLIVYAGGDDGLWRSRDGGISWSRVSSFSARGVVAVAVAPTYPRTVYVVQFQYAWRSRDGGASWSLMNIRGSFGSVEVHPRNPEVVFVGARSGVHRSADGGDTWVQGTGFPYRDVPDIAIDPGRPWIMYAAGSVNGVAKSTDGGRTWKFKRHGLTSLRVHAVAVDPSAPHRVYAGTWSVEAQGGVFVSEDRGASWAPINAGLTTTWVSSLAVSTDGVRLYAGTTAGNSGGGGAFAFHRR
jgi:photosystem II stability/assembly factor-like uncharacterized protein